MSRSRTCQLLVLASLVALAAGPVFGQERTAPAPVEESPAPPSPEASARIDEILEGEEAVLEGLVTSYDPGGRRDPFRSLLAASPRQSVGPRPEGTPGFMIDEIYLKGIFKTSQGFVAHVDVKNQKKSYLLREGDPLYDGDVLRIESTRVVFRQIVNDPTVIKPFREVVKKLR
jgi:type IV pilus assembly protein PilP